MARLFTEGKKGELEKFTRSRNKERGWLTSGTGREAKGKGSLLEFYPLIGYGIIQAWERQKGNVEGGGNCRHAVHQSVGTQTLRHEYEA